jgi:ankyrin repeat protein
LLPHSCSKPLQQQELYQVVRELVEGIYVFNQIPSISFESNHDGSSMCVIPSAYHDTLVGLTMLNVDYFVKSLLHGTTIPQKDKRNKLLDEWKRLPHAKIRETFVQLGMVNMEDDEELGADLYSGKKEPFIRHPAKCVDSALAHLELTPRLTTYRELEQHEDHVSRDMFLRYLDHVNINLVFRQKSIQEEGAVLILDPGYDLMTGVLATKKEKDPELYRYLHSYLQRQRDFVKSHLEQKKMIAHDLELLGFVSFMVSFLVTLRRQTKIVDVSQLPPPSVREMLRTDRELPPVLPNATSKWSSFTSENSTTSLHGGIIFHKQQQTPEPLECSITDLANIRKLSSDSSRSLSSSHEGDHQLQTCEIDGQSYYILSLSIEPFYSKTPKLPRWVHAMITELRSQSAKQPSLSESRVQDMLRKPLGPRLSSAMKTVNISLKASIEKGILPAVGALLKRCTHTRLNKPDENGMTMIHYAAVNGRPDVLSALILAGCSINQQVYDENQQPTETRPIHLAAQSGSLDCICCLVRYGACEVSVRDEQGWAAVHHAAFHNYQCIVAHLASLDPACINLETADRSKSTPLLLAAQNGCFDAFKCLVEFGADLSVTNSQGQNAVHIAALHHHINILKYLITSVPQIDVWSILSEMLASDDGTGYAEGAARSLDPLMQWDPSHYCKKILEHNAVKSLVQLLKKDKVQQHLAVQVLANLSNIDSVKAAMVKADAIPHVVKLLGSNRDRVQSCACIVLSDLGLNTDNQSSIAKAGAIPHLVKLLDSDSDDVQLYASACIGILSFDNRENQSTILENSGLPGLVNLLRSSLSCIKGCAASSLARLLDRNRSCQLAALTANIISPLVVLLRSRKVSVQKSAAGAIEALADSCEESQCELLASTVCINLLKRLLKMQDPSLKVCGGCALWSIAGELISNKRLIASHMGLELLIDMIVVHHERLEYVCSEALGALASELGNNQNHIAKVGGVKPLVDVLMSPTSQRVCLSIIHTLAALVMKPALVPNQDLQKTVASVRGIVVLAAIISAGSDIAAELVRVEAACTLAKIVLNNPENDKILARHTDFSYLTIFRFYVSSDATVRLLAGYCLSIMAFNNPAKLELMKSHGSLHISNLTPFLESDDDFFKVHAAFQIVVLSKLLVGVGSADATVRGIRLLISMLSSHIEQTKVLSAEFIASLAHSRGGIPTTILMAGVLDPLMRNLRTGNGPVIESTSVAIGYLTFNSLGSRMITGAFRDNPELFDVFKEQIDLVTVSRKFLANWDHVTYMGIPVLR